PKGTEEENDSEKKRRMESERDKMELVWSVTGPSFTFACPASFLLALPPIQKPGETAVEKSSKQIPTL
ncbi:Hypothetical predicted protein, partial [Marmota monax]